MISEKIILDAKAEEATPCKRWVNWVEVFELEGKTLLNTDSDEEIPPGIYPDAAIHPSKDAAETYMRKHIAKVDPDTRGSFVWLGAYPEGELP